MAHMTSLPALNSIRVTLDFQEARRMKKTFPNRRVPRKVGIDNDDDDVPHTTIDNPSEDSEPALHRPKTKRRKASSLRKPFGPSTVHNDDDEESKNPSVVAPKRGNLSRIAIQRNASSKLASSLASRRAEANDVGDTRPSYSEDVLQELRASTPSTPLAVPTSAPDVEDVEQGTQALDLSSKFGTSLARYQQQQQSSAIPSAAEIAEKKARRARLAAENESEEFISLNPSDPEGEDEELDENVTRDEAGRLILKPKDKYANLESRLVRDDEDVMEGFDDFTEDGGGGNKILMGVGGAAETEAARKRAADMAARIADAEGASSDSADDSERERIEAFEAAQTSHGTYGQARSGDGYEAGRTQTPPRISPLPTLSGVLDRLQKQLTDLQASRMQKQGEMAALRREKVRFGEEEVRVQRALRETAEKYERLRGEMGVVKEGTLVLECGGETSAALIGNGTAGLGSNLRTAMVGRGLESFGNTLVGTSAAYGGSEESDGDE